LFEVYSIFDATKILECLFRVELAAGKGLAKWQRRDTD